MHGARSSAAVAEPIGRLARFGIDAGQQLVHLAFEAALSLAGPAGAEVMKVIRRAGKAIDTIVKDPAGFLRNLLAAFKGGLNQFVAKLPAHLRDGVIGWLTGALGQAGLTLPKVWDLRGIAGLVMQILNLTYAAVRGKMVKLLGERAVGFVEQAFEFVVTLVQKGIGAAWEQLQQHLEGLVDTVLGGVRSWVAGTVIETAIVKIASMFNPVGAIIQACKVVYDTVTWLIERYQQIHALVESVLDSVEAIAAGSIGSAIDRVEQTMVRSLPVVISFLAGLLGLGGITKKITEVIGKVRGVIDRAIDKVIDWVKAGVAKLFGRQATSGTWDGALRDEEPVRLADGEQHELFIVAGDDRVEVEMASANRGKFLPTLRRVVKDKGGDPGDVAPIERQYQDGQAAVRRVKPGHHRQRIAKAQLRLLAKSVATLGVTRGRGRVTTKLSRTELGRIGRHSTISKGNHVGTADERNRYKGVLTGEFPEELKLEAEHVIPVSWVSLALERRGLRGIDRKAKVRDLDHYMTTINIYRGAAVIKTASDMSMLAALDAMLDSRSSKRTNGSAVPDAFWAIARARIAKTVAAIKQDHGSKASRSMRTHSEALPNAAAVGTAYELQRQEIELVFASRGG